MKTIAFGGIILLFLTAIKGLSPTYFQYLPLGGNSIAETGIILSFAVGFVTLKETFWKSK